MADKEVESFEIKCSWRTAEVKLVTYSNGRRKEYTYGSVPKKVVTKLLGGSKPPSISDFDGWLKEADDAEKKKNSSKGNGALDCCSDNWWSCD